MRWRSLQFRIDGPFRGLVNAFWVGYHGAFDLFTRGMCAAARRSRLEGGYSVEEEREWYDRKVAAGSIDPAHRDLHLAMADFNAPLHPWPFLVACSRGVGDPIHCDARELSAEMAEHSTTALPAAVVQALCGALLTAAHELTRDAWPNQSDPAREFLRHCRHAASHGYRFNLYPGEPKSPARWRHFVVNQDWHRQPLLQEGNDPTNGKLVPGDVLQLLWDLEQSLPPGWSPT